MKCGSYEIVIENGLMNQLRDYIKPNKETIIITDNGIPEEYIDIVEGLFTEPLTLVLPMGEETKSLDIYKHIIEELATRDISPSCQLIALGGGVVGDITGFVASTYLRGVEWIQIPTTLLSQVDSSVGSKVALNHYRKNNIGAFYDPMMVLIDPLVLVTLPDEQFSNGMAEVLKYAFILEPKLFELIDEENWIEVIKTCIECKIKIVEEDKLDKGIRHILNFGHTIGHAIEIDSEYSVLHGEAIGIGMYHMLDGELKELMKKYLTRFNLPITYHRDCVDYIRSDKKIKDGLLFEVFVEQLGKAEIKEVALEAFIEGVNLNE